MWLLLAAPVSQALAQTDYYVKPLLAITQMENYTEGLAIGMAWAKNLYHYLPHTAVEGEIIKSFTTISPTNDDSTNTKRSFTKTAIYAILSYPLDPRLSIKGKLGLYYTAFEDRTGDAKSNSSADGISLEIGTGLLIRLDRHKDLVVEVLTNSANATYYLTAGLQLNY